MNNRPGHEQGTVEDVQARATSSRGPAQFLQESLPLLPKGQALDVAAGSGRNALYLAEHGFNVHAIDRDQEALQAFQDTARERRLLQVSVEVVNLEGPSFPDEAFPSATYDVVLVFFYLFRPLFPAFLRTLKPGGVLICETFLLENHLQLHHPQCATFCLAAQELRTLASGLHVLYYDEGERKAKKGRPSIYTARLLARKDKGRGTLHLIDW